MPIALLDLAVGITLAALILIAPLVLLIYLLVIVRYTPVKSAFFAILVTGRYPGRLLGFVEVVQAGRDVQSETFNSSALTLGALMFLVFTPCLYCNVSDSWMLPNKWQRAFIGAAALFAFFVNAV